MARMCLYGYIQPGRIYLWGLTVCIVLRFHFRKAEASTEFETMAALASHDAGAVYFTEYYFSLRNSMNYTENVT